MAPHPHFPLPLPKGWPRRVRSAAVHAIALARLALTTARGQAREAGTGIAAMPGRPLPGVVVHRFFSMPQHQVSPTVYWHYPPTGQNIPLDFLIRNAPEFRPSLSLDHHTRSWHSLSQVHYTERRRIREEESSAALNAGVFLPQRHPPERFGERSPAVRWATTFAHVEA